MQASISLALAKRPRFLLVVGTKKGTQLFSLLAKDPFQVLDEHEQVQRIGWRRDEVEPFVKSPGCFVFGVYDERSQAGDFRRTKRAQDGVLEHAAADSPPLPIAGNGKPCQHHDRHGVSRQSLAILGGAMSRET